MFLSFEYISSAYCVNNFMVGINWDTEAVIPRLFLKG